MACNDVYVWFSRGASYDINSEVEFLFRAATPTRVVPNMQSCLYREYVGPAKVVSQKDSVNT